MAQFLRPASDVDDGEFLPNTGSDHYATIDESSPDDGDYVYATGNGDFTVALSAGTDPVSSSDHVARYRAKGNGVVDLRVTLLEGSTPIASWTEPAAAATFTNYSHTLSGGEADSITDYTALRFKMEVGDFTAPSLSSASDGTPTADGADDPSVSTNEGNGTLYWAVLTDGGSCTDAQLKAGSGGDIVSGKAGNQAVSGTGTQTTPDITGLSASTNYEIVFLHRDAAGNDSAQASVGLTTTSGGGFAEVGSGSQRNGTTVGSIATTADIAFPGSVTAGNLLIVAGVAYTFSTPSAIASVVGTLHASGWSVLSWPSGSNFTAFVAYRIATSSGSETVTITHGSGDSAFWIVACDEFSGPNATPLDVDGGFSTGSSTTPSDSITTVAANALIIGVMANDQSVDDAITQNDGTLIFEAEDGTAILPGNIIFQIVTTAQAYTIDWTTGTSANWIAATASFKPA